MPVKVPRDNGNGPSSQALPDLKSQFLSAYGNLQEFLSLGSSTESSKPEPGSLTLTSKGGKWSLRLKDPGAKKYCYVVADLLDSALAIAEQGLGDGSLDWRIDQDAPGYKRRGSS